MKRKIIYKTPEEIELIRESCLLVCKALTHVTTLLRPGVSADQIDAEAEQLIRDNGGIPGFKGYNGFPATLCVSVNEQVVHGIPSKNVLQEGDVVSIDCGVYLNEFFGDAAYTFAIGAVKPEIMSLLQTTLKSLYLGIDEARVGKRLGDIGFAIQQYCEKEMGYGVVRQLVGHGIGRSLHEAPEVPNFGRRGRGPKLMEGLVIAIEPMINLGKKDVKTHKDGWTIITRDKMPSAHYEHTVAVRADGPDILSDHRGIEEAVLKNENLTPIRELSLASE